MQYALKLHQDSVCVAVSGIGVKVARSGPGILDLRYFVLGDINALQLPPVALPTRADALWRHSCFEAFVRVPAETAYFEFNFAPSRKWAAYRFEDYRSGMEKPGEISAPSIDVTATADNFELRATLDLAPLAGLPNDALWQLGLCTVIEEAGGGRSHWALTHPPGTADFHHSDCFALETPAV